MKLQYLGDITDYRKYALLRLLASSGRFRIGICWMLTDPDGRRDGNKRSYLGQSERWRRFDPELFDALVSIPAEPNPTDLARIEARNLIPEAVFFGKRTPDTLIERQKFHEECVSSLAGTELVFFDPDNGLEIPSNSKGRKSSSKYLFLDEVAEHFDAGRSVLIYQHYPRVARCDFVADVTSRLSNALNQAPVWSFQTPHVVFLLAPRHEHATRLDEVVNALADRWPQNFLKAERHHHLAVTA